MIIDIFSNFDPYAPCLTTKALFILYHLILLVLFTSGKAQTIARRQAPQLFANITAHSQAGSTISLKGIAPILTSLILILISLNISRLIPATYRGSSRQLIFSASVGFPLWLAILLSSWWFNPTISAAHITPRGAPTVISFALVLIETISTLIRPITLSFRLAANMTAGHVVLGLMASYLTNSSATSFTFILLAQTFYLGFELAIGIIQGLYFLSSTLPLRRRTPPLCINAL